MARFSVPKAFSRVITLTLLALVVDYLVLPQVAGARKALHLVSHMNALLALLGLGLEVLSLVAYAQLTRSLLPPGLPFSRIFRINLSTLSASHVVPGGTAAGASLGYRLFTAEGLTGADVGFALGMQSIGSAVVLNAMLWVSLVVSIPLYGFNPIYVTAAVLGVLLIAFVSLIILFMTRGEDRAVTVLRAVARHLPLVTEDQVEAVFRRVANRLQELTSNTGRLGSCIAWAGANWLFDAASLWVFLAAFGHGAGRFPNPDGVLVAYGVANVVGAIPITPGGLGVIEGVLTPALVGFGPTKGVAILGVLAWRLVNFWLPIPTGAVAYLTVRLDGDRPALAQAGGEDRAGAGIPDSPNLASRFHRRRDKPALPR
jgi:uncharacterized protein (TIRG00374 family)